MKKTNRPHSVVGNRPPLIMPGFSTNYVAPQQRSPGAQKLTQNDVNELKLQIQEIEDQIKKAKTQLLRLNRKIESNENVVNRAFEQSTENTQIIGNSNKQSIPMLEESLKGAKSRIEQLEEDIEKAKKNDRLWQVKEMEQNVAVSFVELKRVKLNEKNEKERENYYREKYLEANQLQESIDLLNNSIQETTQANAVLKDKLIAYKRKAAKNQIEHELVSFNKNKADLTQVINDAEIEQTMNHKKHTENSQKLNEMSEEQMAKINELDSIITSQCAGLKQFLAEHKDELSKNINQDTL